jgi:hypothetical protein
MNKYIYVILTFILLGCGNRHKSVNNISENNYLNDKMIEEDIDCLDSFFNKSNLKLIDIPFNIKKIQEKGLELNDLQKKKLLASVIDFSDDSFTAYFFGFVDLKDNIITTKYLVFYSDLINFYLVNYDCQSFKVLGYISSNQVESGDLIFQGKEKEVYYSGSNIFTISNDKKVRLTSTQQEFTHTFWDDKESVTYKDSIVKYFIVNDLGKFEMLKSDSISEGKSFSFDDVPADEVEKMYPAGTTL